MRELDAPTSEAAVQECGEPMLGAPAVPGMGMPQQQPPAHPSMSVNLNAQGMDNIESLLKLMTKVNPDMINQPSGADATLPVITGPGPSISSIKPELPPLKMLPDFDKEPEGDHSEPDADNMGGPSDNDTDNMPPVGDLDHDEPDADNMGGPSDNDADNSISDIQKSMGDNDGDGDHDMHDHDIEKKDGEEKEAYGNSMGRSEPSEKGSPFDATGDDLNKPKKTFPKVAGGDNPMQRNESKEALRASIRAELLSRLNEAKGAK